MLKEDHFAWTAPKRPRRVGGFKGDQHALPVALVDVVELVEVPKEPVLHDQAWVAGLAS